MYHVLNLARRKLGRILVEGHAFADAFYSCIYGTDTVEEFELCWQHMLQVHNLAETHTSKTCGKQGRNGHMSTSGITSSHLHSQQGDLKV
jgi:hypothetical protein